MNENQIWALARLSVLRVLQTEHRGLLYSLLVFFQCVRYLCRFALIRLLCMLPWLHAIVQYLRRQAALTAVNETKMIALIRDLGVHAKSSGPFDHAKTQAVIEMIVDALGNEKVLDEHTISVLSQKLFQSGHSATGNYWVMGTLEEMARSLPPILFTEGFFGKVIRTMVGVIGYCLHKDKNYPLEKAIELGFHFGVLYLYDEVQDVPNLVTEQERHWIEARVAILLDGSKTSLGEPPGSVSRWIHESASRLEIMCPKAEYSDFYLYLRILAQAQKLESGDTGQNIEYTYTLLALKSAMTRLIPAALAKWDITVEYIHYAMTTGIANQLIDDLRDFPEDYARRTPTPYVRFFQNRTGSPHPFTVYLQAIEASIALLPQHRFLSRILWSIRLTHGMRVLALKARQNTSPTPLSHIWKHYATITGWCNGEIIDIEAVMAKKITNFVSLAARGESASTVSH